LQQSPQALTATHPTSIQVGPPAQTEDLGITYPLTKELTWLQTVSPPLNFPGLLFIKGKYYLNQLPERIPNSLLT